MIQDIKQFGKGARREKEPLFPKTLKSHLRKFGATVLPTTYSLRSVYLQTPIKNQGSQSSCGPNMISKYTEAQTFKRDEVTQPLSPHDIYPYVWLPGGGCQYSDLKNRVADNGIAFESEIPSYDAQGNPLTEAEIRTVVPRTTQAQNDAFSHLLNQDVVYDQTNPDEVKQAIFQGNGAMVAVLGTNPCWQTSEIEIPSIPPTDSTLWGHFITLIGFSDEKKCYEFVNSWGTEWGDGGFGWLPYDYLTKGYGFSAHTEVELPANYVPMLRQLINIYKLLIGKLTSHSVSATK